MGMITGKTPDERLNSKVKKRLDAKTVNETERLKTVDLESLRKRIEALENAVFTDLK